jgi:maltose-binding protein MalE
VSDSIEGAWDGVDLEYEPGGTETAAYQDALRTEIAGGTAPDVFWIPGTDIADFANRGLIMDLRDLAEARATRTPATTPTTKARWSCSPTTPRPDRPVGAVGSAA